MMTAMRTARSILAGKRKFNVWAVNEGTEYHEGGAAGEHGAVVETRVPVPLRNAATPA